MLSLVGSVADGSRSGATGMGLVSNEALHRPCWGERPGPVEVRDLGYRWGSCGVRRLPFYWRVVSLPPRIIDPLLMRSCAPRAGRVSLEGATSTTIRLPLLAVTRCLCECLMTKPVAARVTPGKTPSAHHASETVMGRIRSSRLRGRLALRLIRPVWWRGGHARSVSPRKMWRRRA